MADAAASEAAAAKAWRFKSSRVYQHSLASPSGQGIGPTHRHPQVRVLERPTSAWLVWRPTAPARRTGDPRFEPATKHHHLSRRSTAERPADNRKTVVRYHAEEPST